MFVPKAVGGNHFPHCLSLINAQNIGQSPGNPPQPRLANFRYSERYFHTRRHYSHGRKDTAGHAHPAYSGWPAIRTRFLQAV